VGVADIAFGYTEGVDLLPILTIIAGHNQYSRRCEYHMSVWTTAEGQIKSVLKTAEVGEGIVVAVVENLPD
jgi:hypothetical protein